MLVDGTNGTNVATPFSDGSISFDTILGTNSITGSEISGGCSATSASTTLPASAAGR